MVRNYDINSIEERIEKMDNSKRRSYDIYDIEERVYQLEKNGSQPPAGDDLIAHWDFTKATNPMVDEVNGFTATTWASPVVSDKGVFIDTDGQCIYLPIELLMVDTTYEVKFGTVDLKTGQSNARIFVYRPYDYSGSSENPTTGLCYSFGNNNKYGTYDQTNGWQLSDESDVTALSGATLKIYIDVTRKWHIYIDDELILETTKALSIQQSIFAIGCPASSCDDAYIEDIKIYRGEH